MNNVDEQLLILADSYVELVRDAKNFVDLQSLLRTLALRAALVEVQSLEKGAG